MKHGFSFLMGIVFLHFATGGWAQAGRYTQSNGPALSQLFSTVIRSSVVRGADTPATLDKKPEVISAEALKICCEKVSNDKRRIYYLSDRNSKMILQLDGIYTRETLLFFHLSLNNRSNLDYDMDSIRFFIADGAPGSKSISPKRTELIPVYVYGNTKSIRGKNREHSVIAFRRFTLPPGKRLLIEAREKNGGRHLLLQADNYSLVRARLI
jgi:hypothetical protein